MKSKKWKTVFGALFFLTFGLFKSEGAVSVIPASAGTCLNVLPGAYFPIGNITISEGTNADFAVQTNATLVLSAPANFLFNAGTGTVSFTGGGDITSASISVTATNITITFSSGGTAFHDDLIISNIEAVATVSPATGQILRPLVGGGSAVIAGDAAGGGINHGTLSTAGLTFTSVSAGNWWNPATWGGNVPNCNANVVINHAVTADNAAIAANLTINSGGILTSDFAITVNGAFTMNGSAAYVHNNLSNAGTTIFSGTETFSPGSTIQVNQWYDRNVPLANNINSNFGNVTLNAGSSATPWDLDGRFTTRLILGTLTVMSGQVEMDDGAGMTTSLALNDVLITGTGNLIIARGSNRNLTLTTGNFTDNSTSASLSVFMRQTYGTLDYTCNGNFSTSHSFNAILGTGTQTVNATMHITGNMNLSGGTIDMIRNVNGNFALTVDGTANFSGNGVYRIINAPSCNFTFNASALTFSGSTSVNYLQGSTGTVSINIANDLISSGTGTFFLTRNTANVTAAAITIGGNIICSSGIVHAGNSSQNINLSAVNLFVTNSGTIFYGQSYNAGLSNTSITIANNMVITSGTFQQSLNRGSATLSIGNLLQLNAGNFTGIRQTNPGNWGNATVSLGSVDYNGGIMSFFDGKIADGRTVTVNVSGDFNADFMVSSDRVYFIQSGTGNNSALDLNINGNLIVSGASAGCFLLTNAGSGNQTVDILGSMTVSGGQSYFAGTDAGVSNPSNLALNITGEFVQSGGLVVFAAQGGSSTVNIVENFLLSGGTATLKYDVGTVNVNVSGDFNQTGGSLHFHSRNADTPDPNTLSVYGGFYHTGGTMDFDYRQGNTSAEHHLNIYGNLFTIGGSGIISHRNHLTGNTRFGNINFNTPGTVIFNRTSSSHDIRQVRIQIAAGCVVDAAGSVNDMEIASHSSSGAAVHTTLTVNGTLVMGTRRIFGRQQNNYYSAITVNGGGRIRTQHIGGLYSGSASPSCINSMILTRNNMNYSLDANSTIEYYGTDNQSVTGIPNGIANGNQHKYGRLEINFTGTPDAEFVYPETSNEVFVRTALILSNGEFNLDNDHNTLNGGRTVNIENGATISRTNGYVRSEVDDGSGILAWNITSTGVSHVFPFGYNSAEYIPFTFNASSGSAGTVSVSTYHTAPNNVVYPPGVSHVNDLTGADNSAFTVDRFWRINVTGSPVSDYTFTATPSETGAIASPRSQRWIPSTMGWELPQGVQSNPTSNSNFTSAISGLTTWWALSSSSSPLPVELSSLRARCRNNHAVIEWSTASEINNDYFVIERSNDNLNFIRVAMIKGSGNTSIPHNYSFEDNSIITGKYFYRLSQIDYNGTSRSFAPVTVTKCINAPATYIESAFSSGGEVVVNIYSNAQTKDRIILTDANGRQVDSKFFFFDEGTIRIVLGKNLASGIYFIVTDSGSRKRVAVASSD